jgi:hypothetical protein
MTVRDLVARLNIRQVLECASPLALLLQHLLLH